VIITDQSTGATDYQTTSFKVTAPDLQVIMPSFNKAVLNYSTNSANPSDYHITMLNVGDADIDNMAVELSDTEHWNLVKGSTSIPVRTNITDWKIQPKIGLEKGEYHASLTVSYGYQLRLKARAEVDFRVTAADVKINVTDFDEVKVNYQAPEKNIELVNDGDSSAKVWAEISNTSEFTLFGDCGSSVNPVELQAKNANKYSKCQIKPVTGLHRGEYRTQILVHNTLDGLTTTHDIFFRVSGANLAVIAPIFNDELLKYTNYNQDSSAKTISIVNAGDNSSDIDVHLNSQMADSSNFNLIEDTTSRGCDNNSSREISGKLGDNNQCWSIKPLSGLPAGTYKTQVIVVDQDSGLQASSDVSFKVTEPTLELDVVDFPATAQDSVGKIPAEAVIIKNKGDGSSTHTQVTATNTESGSAFELSGPSTSAASQNPVVIKAQDGIDGGTWKIKPQSNLNQIKPGTYSTIITAQDTQTGAITSAKINLTVTGPAFIVETNNINNEIVGYETSSFGQINIDNLSENEELFNVELSNDTNFILGKIKNNGSNNLCENLDSKDRYAEFSLAVDSHNSEYCIKPIIGLARGTYNTDVKVLDLSSGIEKISGISFKVTSPSLNIADKQESTVNLHYDNQDATPIEVQNLGDAVGYYYINVSNSDIFNLEENKGQADPMSLNEDVRIKPKDGLPAGTYTSTVILTYSPYQFSVNSSNIGSGQNANGSKSMTADDVLKNIHPENGASMTQVKNTILQETAFLSFKVTAPSLQLSPIDFGESEYPNNSNPSQPLAISNNGDGLATIKSVESNSDKFIVRIGSKKDILPGETNSTFKIQPKNGLEAGKYQAVITADTEEGVKASTVVYFKVTEPMMSVSLPALGMAVEGYKDVEPRSIIMTENADIPATIKKVTVDNADFEIKSGDKSIQAKATNKSWEITPKEGLLAGNHDAIVKVEYNGGEVVGNIRFQVKTAEEMRKEIGTMSDEEIKNMINADEKQIKDWEAQNAKDNSANNSLVSKLFGNEKNSNDKVNNGSNVSSQLDAFDGYFWWPIIIIIILLLLTIALLIIKSRKKRIVKLAKKVNQKNIKEEK
jgi:hypothetical protein